MSNIKNISDLEFEPHAIAKDTDKFAVKRDVMVII